jgi:hypothetical protein
MSIGGKVREQKEFADFTKMVGVGEFEVVAVNPDAEQWQELTGQEPKEDSKQFEYLGESEDGNKTVRISLYLREVKNKAIFNVSFFLEDRERENKEEAEVRKHQWINDQGNCTWLPQNKKEKDLPEWFAKDRDVRIALSGEEELYSFLRAWLQKLDYRDASTVLALDTKKLFKGNVKDIRDQVGGEYSGTVLCLATVKTKEVDGQTKSYQVINNRNFLPGFNIKNFNKKFTPADAQQITDVLKGEDKAAKKKIKPFERFIAQVLDAEYGVKEYFGSTLGLLQEYRESDDVAAGEAVANVADDDSSY